MSPSFVASHVTSSERFWGVRVGMISALALVLVKSSWCSLDWFNFLFVRTTMSHEETDFQFGCGFR
jgi:hypothetical protein